MQKPPPRRKDVRWAAVGCLLTGISIAAAAIPKDVAAGTPTGVKPNIVLINMDNFGYGELGVYGGGILRGGATPRIDALASEGLRLLNFNVEAQCTPSRAALMTGRYAIRTGNGSVPLSTPRYGLTQWEYTMAEMLSDAGYQTAMYGKWHLGQTEGRFPTDQGFDEWYGTPNSTDESQWPGIQQFESLLQEDVERPGLQPMYIMEGTRNAKPTKVKIFEPEFRPEIDRELTDRAKDFISRQAKSDKPFFLYLPYTLTHAPVQASKEFAGKSGNGRWGDVLMQIDAYTGELLDTITELGIEDETIFIFTSDNGPEMVLGQEGWSGPWRGSYFTGREGSLRVPFIIRWPGKVPAGGISNEIVHQFDLYRTLASITGGKVPTDRIIDSKDMSAFFLGKNEKSGREGFVVYVGNTLTGVKWRNWKMMFKELEGGLGTGRMIEWPMARIYNLYDDPKEQRPYDTEKQMDLWVRWAAAPILTEHMESLQAEPPIKPGIPDPYVPATSE